MSSTQASASGFEVTLEPRSVSSISYLGMIKTVICCCLALLLWRIWRFTIYPSLYREVPKAYPYWIPYLGLKIHFCQSDRALSIDKSLSGHSHAFFQDSNGLLARAKESFNNTGEPFALMALGTTFYVVTQPKHSAEVYRNSETLSFEAFVQGLMRSNGNDENAIDTMYAQLPDDKIGFPNPQGVSLGVLAQKMHVHQLHPGKNLVDLQKAVHSWIDHHLKMDPLREGCAYATSQTSTHLEVPLYRWCSDYLIRLGQHVYFGNVLDEVDPSLPDTFLEFDEVIWKMLYRYPGFLSRDMSVPRAQVIASLKKYFQVPQCHRSDGTAWLINAMEDETRALGVDDDNLAVIIFHLYLAINTNTRKTVFWILAYLIYHPSSLDAYRREIEPAFNGDELVDHLYIQDSANCPEVDNIWHETLRLSAWGASVRLITEDTIIGGKLMRKGNHVMVPHRLLHFDETVFGDETHLFRPERWKKDSLARSPTWKPFGAGKTMCSGRFLARFSVTTFVAILLRRFDVELIGTPPFPQADMGRPVLGIMSIKEGQDIIVKLLPKAKSSV